MPLPSQVKKCLSAPLRAAVSVALAVPGSTWANPEPPPPGFGGSSTLFSTTVTGQRAGGFLDPVLGHQLERSVGFEVFGLPQSTVTHWHYEFNGSVAAAADDSALQLQATFSFDFIHAYLILQNTSWSVSWVDGPPAFGDFAGNISSAPGIHGCCYTLPTTWSPHTFSGAGAIGFVTDIPLATGIKGAYTHAVGMGLSGSIQSTLSVSLVAITVDLPPNAASRSQAAYLLLEDGSQFPITSAVPEPHAGLLALGGVLGLGWLVRRRRLPLG